MSFVFTILAISAVLSAIGVITSRTPVYSALWLVLNLFLVASLYAVMDAHFLAASQIIVYAGAIMVLVLFVIMLLGLVGVAPKFSPFVTVVSLVAGVGFVAVLTPLFIEFARSSNEIGVTGDVKSVGRLLFTTYLYPFEAASFLIIGAIVGAFALAKKRRT